MMKSDEQYQVPVWMRPLLPLLCNTGGNDPEELLNDTETTASANIVRYVLIVAGKRLVRTVLIFTESSDQLSRATDRVPGLPASPGYVQ